MLTWVFWARLAAGQVTTFFGYSRGLNGDLAVEPSEATEMIRRAITERTRTESIERFKRKVRSVAAPAIRPPVRASSLFLSPQITRTLNNNQLVFVST